MKKPHRKAAAVSVCFFAAAAAAVSAGMIFLERPKISETEKRELETFPELTSESWFSGEFSEGVDKWYTDTVPHREEIVEAAAEIEDARGISSPKFYGNVAEVGGDESSESFTEPVLVLPDTETAAADEMFPETESTSDVPDVTESGSSSASETETQTSPLTESETSSSAPETSENTSLSSSAAENQTQQSSSQPSQTAAEAVTASPAPTETAAPAVTEEEEEFKGNISEFLNNGILVDGVNMYGQKAGVMLFGGNKAEGKKYASIIADYKAALGKDVNVYNIVVPTSAEFYLPKKFSKYSSSEKAAIDNIYENLPDDVITADAYSKLAEHADEYIYFRTDHHWTGLGAYYAYTAFCEAAGLEIPELSSYDVRTRPSFVGSLYTFTGDVTLKNNPDDFYYYVPAKTYTAQYFDPNTFAYKANYNIFHEYASGVNTYGLFLGADNVHIKITVNNEQPTGRKIAVFKESYGNAFVPYLLDGFDMIYVIDIRYFGQNAVTYLKNEGITDVLFINNAFAANTDSLISKIGKLYSSPYGTRG